MKQPTPGTDAEAYSNPRRFDERQVQPAYLSLVGGILLAVTFSAILDPSSVLSLTVDDGPLDRLSTYICSVVAVLSFGYMWRLGHRRSPWLLIVSMLLGFVGFLNATGSGAGPLPYGFRVTMGMIEQTSALPHLTNHWPVTLIFICSLAIAIVAFFLRRRKKTKLYTNGGDLFLSALLLASLSSMIGELIGDARNPLRSIVEMLEVLAALGLLLSSWISGRVAILNNRK